MNGVIVLRALVGGFQYQGLVSEYLREDGCQLRLG